MRMKTTEEYMESSPLIVWARSVPHLTQGGQQPLAYDNLPNGQYFFQILKHADTRLQNVNLPNEGDPYDTVRSRLLNLDYILRHVKKFYTEDLNQILLIKLPDIYHIAKYPESG
jgi:hypothetical protein